MNPWLIGIPLILAAGGIGYYALSGSSSPSSPSGGGGGGGLLTQAQNAVNQVSADVSSTIDSATSTVNDISNLLS